MFIVCGVLYAIDSVTERNTKIHLALDLYRGVVLDDVNLPFTNPFKNTTMALYNPETKVDLSSDLSSAFCVVCCRRFSLQLFCRLRWICGGTLYARTKNRSERVHFPYHHQ